MEIKIRKSLERISIPLGCVHTDMSMSTSTGPGFRLWPIKVLLMRVKCSRSLVQAHNSTRVSHIELNRIEEMLRE